MVTYAGVPVAFHFLGGPQNSCGFVDRKFFYLAMSFNHPVALKKD